MANGRHRVRPGPAPGEAGGSGGSDRADQEPPEPLVPRAREPSLVIPEIQPGDQRSGPPAGQETAPQSWRDFLYRVCKDQEARKGLCRLMWHGTAIVVLLLAAVTVFLYITMPGSQLVKAIMTVCTILGGSGMHA